MGSLIILFVQIDKTDMKTCVTIEFFYKLYSTKIINNKPY